jgi:bifunctional UDP-N-acetylglucosamine pyrophosphorylase/glucosamine-1-phosphate N-acetyltransferase
MLFIEDYWARLARTLMDNTRVLIVAAGKGTRSGLTYPKTLFPVQGIPILIRLIKLFSPYDRSPAVIVSKDGLNLVKKCLQRYSLSAELIVQDEQKGMGDAILYFKQPDVKHVILAWGDIPFIQTDTVSNLVQYYFDHNSDFSFVTKDVNSAYTVVVRDKEDNVSKVLETRESGFTCPQGGERDIGLFLFKKDIVFNALRKDLTEKWGSHTGEHGFLYIIEYLVLCGYKVDALKIATELDTVSFNSMNDISLYLNKHE